MRRGPIDRLAITASVVFIADFATKQWALRALGDGDLPIGAGWHLAVVNNTRLAGGLEAGGFELPITAVFTTIVALLIVLVCRQLATIDGSAPTALGLVAGAGAANLANAFPPPHGVVDFIAFSGSRGETSFNVADVLFAVGLALCLRTIWRLALTVRGRVPARRRARLASFSGVPLMSDRVLLAAGHGLLAMCGFMWLYSLAIAFTPDAGRSAPNSLLCGVGVFAIAFVASRARQRLIDRRLVGRIRAVSAPSFERVVLDGSIPGAALPDLAIERPRTVPRGDIVTPDDRSESHIA
ncbi:MAG TPA: signal peptidase II [Gemmatimonadaceae bacterium]